MIIVIIIGSIFLYAIIGLVVFGCQNRQCLLKHGKTLSERIKADLKNELWLKEEYDNAIWKSALWPLFCIFVLIGGSFNKVGIFIINSVTYLGLPSKEDKKLLSPYRKGK